MREMASSDSNFLFEISVEDFKSYTSNRKFAIKCQFRDIFSVQLRNPHEVFAEVCASRRKRSARKGRNSPTSLPRQLVPFVKTVVVEREVSTLISYMRQYPIELVVWSQDTTYAVGWAEMPWNNVFIQYLLNPNRIDWPAPKFKTKCHVYDEYSSKKLACVRLKIQLCQIQGCTAASPVSQIVSQEADWASTNEPPVLTSDDTGIIKTTYRGTKRKPRQNKNHSTLIKFTTENEDNNMTNTTVKNSLNDAKEHKEVNRQVVSFNCDGDANNDNDVCEQKHENKIKNYEIAYFLKNQFEKSLATLARSHKIIESLPVSEPSNQNDNNSLLNLVLSQTDIASNKNLFVKSSKSCSAILAQKRVQALKCIFGDPEGPFGNQVYWVEYFTVQNATEESNADSKSESPSSPHASGKDEKSVSETTGQSPKGYFKFKVCGSDCNVPGVNTNPCFDNICSTDLPESMAHKISVRKCTHTVECDNKRERGSLLPQYKPIYLNMGTIDQSDPETIQKIEQVVGGVEAKVKIGEDPCYCTCECKFGFVKRTTFCKVCGGYEKVGEDIAEMTKDPFPCPIFHNLVVKGKKGQSIRDVKENVTKEGGERRARSKSPTTEKSDRQSITDKNIESEGLAKKKKKKVDERFKFNYGYTAPKIGHVNCFTMCGGGTISADKTGQLNVPKHMGWLWTAENVPGLKFRPCYRPGATNKKVVRMLRGARHPEQVIARRKRKEGSKGRPAKRPLLIVQKKDGEYTVTMETMKSFPKMRYPNQIPFEDKPPITYTIGRTEEENKERARRRAREQRRLERYQREFIQSAFRDMCKEICLKTYRQALQFLPHTEDPPCSCFPAIPGPDRIDLEHSCSCSDASKSTLGSVTDDDEWVVEFTPPVAYYNPAYKGKKIHKVDNSTQYTYLDYRVKLLDRLGNPVPRFFKGPDGTQQCSDLGGFWGPDGKWLEINVDGYVGADERWAPNSFIGPNGDTVDAESGKFQAPDGTWLIVGVDGYVDCQGKWRYYSKPCYRGGKDKNKKGAKDSKVAKAGGAVVKNKLAPENKPSQATWSCFGDTSPTRMAEIGILGHGRDRQLLFSTLEKILGKGNVPQVPRIPAFKAKKAKRRISGQSEDFNPDSYFTEKYKCKHHPPPSGKGIIAVDGRGNKTFFRLKDYQNPRPKDRLVMLDKEGYSLSSFHVPCFSSFINNERHPAWKPGAISKRLLSKLKAAKLRALEVEKKKPLKRHKKRNEDKPTLIVAKRAGEYFVELQVDPEGDCNYEQCKPLIYKITSADNEERVKRRQYREQRLIKKAAKSIFTDPNHHRICEQTCLKAYKQAIGMEPYDPNKPQCICPEVVPEVESESSELDYDSSDYSDLDLDWEMHFTPPIAFHE